MKSWTIVGYTYQADSYHPQCVLAAMDGEAPAEDVEAKLDYLAPYYGVEDREDENSFDSGDFPKVIFASQVEDDSEICGHCLDPLLD